MNPQMDEVSSHIHLKRVIGHFKYTFSTYHSQNAGWNMTKPVYLDKIVGPGHKLCGVRFGNENGKLLPSLIFCSRLDLKQKMQI